MQQSKTGTYVPPPTGSPNMTGSHRAGGKVSKGTPYVASQNLSSAEAKSPEDKMGTHVLAQSSQTIGNGNVKKTGYETPSADIGKSEYLSQGGRGPGGM